MKAIGRMFFVLIVISIFAGCGMLGSNKEASIGGKDIIEEVIIKAYYDEPLSLKEKGTIVINGINKGDEYVEIIVKGEIFDFEQVALTWDDNKNNLVEKEIMKKIDKISNKTLVVKTILPEGIPSEKLKWKSRTGEIYEYIVQEDGQNAAPNKVINYTLK